MILKKTIALILFSFIFCAFSQGANYELMSYNVQHLFDTVHDEGKNDWKFLPKEAEGKREGCLAINIRHYRESCLNTDWNERKLNIKIAQIKKVILRESEGFRLPDFLALNEVENSRVVSLLARELGFMEFQISDGPDTQGSDSAILYNPSSQLHFKTMREHRVPGSYFGGKWKARNILEVEFKVGEKQQWPLTIFVNHWPNQRTPSEARLKAARTLKRRIDQILNLYPDHLIVALGDFNTTPSDFPHPFKTILTAPGKSLNIYQPFRTIPTALGEEGLLDVHEIFMAKKIKNLFPLGTHFHGKKMKWRMLDRIFISQNLFDGKGPEVDLTSYQIYAPPFIRGIYEYKNESLPYFGTKIFGVPKRYNHNTENPEEAGYSDHFPVLVKINVPQ